MSLRVRATLAERGLDVDLDVATGEVVALLGPNGAGKSTLLSILSGTLRPDTADLTLHGRTLARLEPAGARTAPSAWVAPHARGVALLAQDALLFPHLSALDNVAFGPRSTGASRPASRETAARWLAEVDAADLADRRPHQLSGGQAQRVAIARALAAQPRLLLLDEPMAALDVGVAPVLRQVLRRVLRGEARERTAIVITHDVLDALLLADRVVVLDAGRVVEDGPSGDVLARPRSAFAASLAGLNLLRGRWDGAALVTDVGLALTGLTGLPGDAGLVTGASVVGVFRPGAVAVFAAAPGGSPRNNLAVTVTAVEPRGDQVRIRAGDLSADITPQSAAELDLTPGVAAVFAVKATEVALYPA